MTLAAAGLRRDKTARIAAPSAIMYGPLTVAGHFQVAFYNGKLACGRQIKKAV
jgi:hypothetical protein